MASRCRRTIFLLLFILTLTCGCHASNATVIEDILQTQLVARDDLFQSRTNISKRTNLFKLRKPSFDFKKTFHQRIVVVGYLHGNLENAKKVLKLSHVVNDNGDWSGLVHVFVQLGNVIGWDSDKLELVDYLEKLRRRAPKGSVFTLMGKTEFMSVIGDWRGASSEELPWSEAEKRWKQIRRIGKIWLKKYITALWLPLYPAIGAPNSRPKDRKLQDTLFSDAALSFTHAGLSPDYADLEPFPGLINDISNRLIEKSWSRKQVETPVHFLNREGTSAERFLLYGRNGPLRYRGWTTVKELCNKADGVLKRTRTRRMIMGETTVSDIWSRCGGKVIAMGPGTSHDDFSALVIDYTVTYVGEEDGAIKLREEEKIDAVYPNEVDHLVHDTRIIELKEAEEK